MIATASIPELLLANGAACPADLALSALARLESTAVALRCVLEADGAMLGEADVLALAWELERLAGRLEALADAAGMAADPLRVVAC